MVAFTTRTVGGASSLRPQAALPLTAGTLNGLEAEPPMSLKVPGAGRNSSALRTTHHYWIHRSTDLSSGTAIFRGIVASLPRRAHAEREDKPAACASCTVSPTATVTRGSLCIETCPAREVRVGQSRSGGDVKYLVLGSVSHFNQYSPKANETKDAPPRPTVLGAQSLSVAAPRGVSGWTCGTLAARWPSGHRVPRLASTVAAWGWRRLSIARPCSSSRSSSSLGTAAWLGTPP